MKNKVFNMLTAFAVPAVIVIFMCLANGIIFNGNNSILFSDLSNIYADHLIGIKHLIWEKKSLIYNWNVGGGINNLPYILGQLNLTNILVLITPDSIFQEMILLTQIVRLGLAGVTCYIYLTDHYKCRNIKTIAFSSAYAVSGYSICFIQHIMWYESIALLPILVLLVERLIKSEKTLHIKFICVLVYTFFTSYYLGYMISLFLFLYSIAFAYKNNRKIFESIFKLGLNGAIAAGLSAIFLFPTFSAILDSGEVADLHFGVKFGIEDIVNQFFLGTFDTYRPDGRPLLYCGIYTVLFLISYTLSDVQDKKKWAADIILLLAMFIFLIVLPLYYVWHMFDQPNWFEGRFTFIIIFYIVTLAYEASESRSTYKYRNIVISAFWMCGILFDCSQMFSAIDKQTLIINYAFIITYCAICIIFQERERIMTILLPIVMCVELLINAVVCSKDMFATERCEDYLFYKKFLDTNKAAVAYIEQNDADFYRIEKTYYRRENDLAAAGGKALSSFGTFYNVDFMSMLERMGITGGQAGRYIGGTPVTDLLLSVRYIVSDNAYDPFYNSINSINGKTIFKNPYKTGMGMLVNTGVENIDIRQYTNPIDLQNAIIKTWENDNDNIMSPVNQCEMNTVNLVEEISEYKNVRIFKKINNLEDAYVDIVVKKNEQKCLYAYIPNDVGNVTLMLNGMYINDFKGQKDKVINLEKDTYGSNYITLRIKLNEEMISIPDDCIYALDIERLNKWASDIKYASLENFNETNIRFNAECDEEQLLLLSIPFDGDWNIYINGEKRESFQVLGGLIGVKVGEGNNIIQIIYKPEGLREGKVVSFFSALLLIILLTIDAKNFVGRDACILVRKKKHNDELPDEKL